MMSRETNMSDGSDRPEPEVSSSASHLHSGSPGGLPSGPEMRANAPRTDDEDGRRQFIAELKRGIENTRLPADVKEQILAQMPPHEEQERLYRELQEKGGISSDQFLKSLGLEVKPQP